MGIPLLVGTCKKKRYTKVNPDSGVLNTTKYLDYLDYLDYLEYLDYLDYLNWKEVFFKLKKL